MTICPIKQRPWAVLVDSADERALNHRHCVTARFISSALIRRRRAPARRRLARISHTFCQGRPEAADSINLPYLGESSARQPRG